MLLLKQFLKYFLNSFVLSILLWGWPGKLGAATDTSKWDVYQNSEFGFSLTYPKDWQPWEKKAVVYPPNVLFAETSVCFSPLNRKDIPCLVEVYVTQETQKFKAEAEAFLGLPVFERSSAPQTPTLKSGISTERVDVISPEGEYFANIFFEKHKRIYLFVMKNFIKDHFDYLAFLSFVASFSFDVPTSQPVISAKFLELFKLEEKEFDDVIVKLTYLGPQTKPILTLLISPLHSETLDTKRFIPYRREGFAYSNDELSFRSIQTTSKSLKSLIDSLHSYPHLLGDRPAKEAYVAAAFLKESVDGLKYFETILDTKGTGEFFILLRNALRSDGTRESVRLLQSWGCSLGLLPPIPGKDVSAKVEILKSGIRFNTTTENFEQTVTLKNISKDSIPGPISLVVDVEGTSHLADSDGTTCLMQPAGRSFVDVPLPSGRYGNFFPQEVLEITLPFKVGEGESVSYSTQVISTSGER